MPCCNTIEDQYICDCRGLVKIYPPLALMFFFFAIFLDLVDFLLVFLLNWHLLVYTEYYEKFLGVLHTVNVLGKV